MSGDKTFHYTVAYSCPNHCKYCINRISTIADIENASIKSGLGIPYGSREEAIKVRMEYAHDEMHCNIVILTGYGEPLMNLIGLEEFGRINAQLRNPFRRIEIQTSGIGLTPAVIELLKKIGVSTIAFSLSAFDNKTLAEYQGFKTDLDIDKTCDLITSNGFNLRLCINLLKYHESKYSPKEIFKFAKDHHASQVTLRILVDKIDGEEGSQETIDWIKANSASNDYVESINKFIRENGQLIIQHSDVISTQYDMYGMSTMLIGTARMHQECISLRRDLHLYRVFTYKGSLIF